MTQLVTSSPGISFPTLVDDALTQAGVSPTVRTVTADMVSYISSDGKQAPQIALPRAQLSAAQLMILLQKLMGVSGDALLATMKTQVDTLEHATRSQLQEHLKKFDEMLAQQAKERASRSRGGVLGWIQRVATAIVSVVVLAAIGFGTGGVGVVPVVMALMAMGAAAGALADMGLSLAGRKSLGEEMGADWGAALLTCNLGELLAIGAREAGLNQDWQIAAAVIGTFVMVVAMGKFGSTAQTQARVGKILARTTDLTMRFNLVTGGVTNLGGGFEGLTQARIHKWISELRADLLNDQTEVTLNQEMTEKTLEVVRAVQEGLTKFFEDAAESVSQEFQGLGALLDTPSRRHAVA
jgi:hypothetical protein